MLAVSSLLVKVSTCLVRVSTSRANAASLTTGLATAVDVAAAAGAVAAADGRGGPIASPTQSMNAVRQPTVGRLRTTASTSESICMFHEDNASNAQSATQLRTEIPPPLP